MARKRKCISNATLKSIVERQGSTNCHYCGKTGDSKIFTGSQGKGSWLWIEHEVDHIEPHSIGGSDDSSNLVISCRECNSKKRDKVGWSHGS